MPRFIIISPRAALLTLAGASLLWLAPLGCSKPADPAATTAAPASAPAASAPAASAAPAPRSQAGQYIQEAKDAKATEGKREGEMDKLLEGAK